jgi:hypothetical protein
MVTAFGGGGLHSGTAMAALFVLILASPLSWVAASITDSLNAAPTDERVHYLFLGMLAVCALVNAGVIYLVVGFLTQALRALFRTRLK